MHLLYIMPDDRLLAALVFEILSKLYSLAHTLLLNVSSALIGTHNYTLFDEKSGYNLWHFYDQVIKNFVFA